jgi:MFS family permease
MKSAWKNRNLQLYFSGQFVSLIGSWMQQMALSWLVYKMTGSTLMLGMIVFASQIPSLFVTPFAGVLADRANRHRLILITQSLAMVQATLLAALVWSGQAQLWQLVVLSGLLGVITAFDLPTRQSFQVDLLDNNEQLASAIGINSFINTITRLIGPFVAGLLVALAGEAVCFLVNALSYIAVIVALLFVKPRPAPARTSKKGTISSLKEGFAYTCGSAPIRQLISFLALFAICAMPFTVLMPAFAKDIFHGDAMTLGFLTGATGAGSVAGALSMTSRKGTQGLSKWVIIGTLLCGIGLVGFGLSTYLPLSLLAVALAGFGSMITMAGSNTLIQTIVEEDKRGRVMSFVLLAFLGLSPFGSIVAGFLANSIGAGITVAMTGILTLAMTLIFASRIMSIHVNTTLLSVEQGIVEADEEMAINA